MRSFITIIILFSSFVCMGQIQGEIKIAQFGKADYIFYSVKEDKDSVFTGNDTIYFEENNDTIMVILEYIKGQRVKARGYYSNGNLYQESNYRDRERFGPEIKCYPDGSLEWITYYDKNSKYPFPHISYYKDGSLESFSTGNRYWDKGRSIQWYPTGNKKHENICIDTTEKGFIERLYYETGELQIEMINNMGRQKYTEFYRNGKLYASGFIYNAIWNQVGHWQEWYENGIKKREYYFNENTPNIKVGTWSWWDEEGNLIKQEIYKNNELIDKKEFIPMKIKED